MLDSVQNAEHKDGPGPKWLTIDGQDQRQTQTHWGVQGTNETTLARPIGSGLSTLAA